MAHMRIYKNFTDIYLPYNVASSFRNDFSASTIKKDAS